MKAVHGRFVVVLGVDGSGKSSLMASLGTKGLTTVDRTSVLEIPELQGQPSERMRGHTSHLPTTRLSSLDTPPAALAEELLRILT